MLQEVEEVWCRLGTGDNIPLKKTAFSMTIKGITRCIFDNSFEDQLLVDKVSAAYMSAWGEIEVCVCVFVCVCVCVCVCV